MDIAEIAHRAGLPPRRLRYVLEHNMLPMLSRIGQGKGVTRDYDARQSFVLALAALLFEAGLRRELVQEFLDHLNSAVTGKKSPGYGKLLDAVFGDVAVSHVEIADDSNLRLVRKKLKRASEGGGRWVQITTGAGIETTYEPLVVVRVAVGLLRERLQRDS
jgi:DNA-binding transcriptional MerR regulator